MARDSLFNSPFLLGFEPFELALDRIAKASGDGYPPYNIEQAAPDRLRITLAVAGFAPDELSVVAERNQLVIRGKQADDGARVFLHRGIAARQFTRSFVLADGIEITGATLDAGLLRIDLLRAEPPSTARTIEIETAPGKRNGTVSPRRAVAE